MTRGNQRELACQKNMKKQSDSVKGKRQDDGLSAAACKQRDSEIMQQKQKKENEKKEEPNTDGIPFALSLQRVPFVLPSPQVASLPTGHSWG
ncbi:Small EDRK-rich factor 2 [Microtus ochrogaster]|uniref:Small EDRK-rich factor 2 n=1 Tax=Microtus ochrogaster TaxID=79684 RepID=A0A8J6G7T6_MICOH|nr:Small EDRK-rich factor 2 [Microtus ochrogaster]